jgi:hypothetical protein
MYDKCIEAGCFDLGNRFLIAGRARADLQERRKMMQNWADYLDKLKATPPRPSLD